LSSSLAETYQSNKGRAATTIRFGRLTFENVTPRELSELCAEQFLLRVRPT